MVMPKLEGREELHQRGKFPRKRAGEKAQDLGQERQEDPSQDRPQHAPQAADDDHPQLIDGEREREVLRADDPRVIGEQRPGDPHVEGADAEGEHLEAEHLDAHHLGGDVLIADGDERFPDARAEEVLREPEVQDARG